ncbi:lipopolysaccharide biosynthesis protein [Halostella salina]|uniref:lipopolysaccharide biosynthesis protein n=1 Tax=Halostella salina TaxID=1547897 RepID=UPI0013CF3675|nr:polysaccharide biosynthesis C-terminal domain-containing protein [Halostella salina]
MTNYPVYVRYGIPMLPKAVSSGLLAQMDRYLILVLISPVAAGTYAIGRGLSAFITNISRVLNPTLYPSVSGAWEEDRFDEISKLYTDIIRYYFLIAIPAIVGLSYLAQPIITLISTPSISNESWILVPILGVGFFLRGIDNMLSYILTAAENTQKIAKSVMIAVCINIPANLILIHEYGITGAAIATVVAQSTAFILIYRYATSEIAFAIPWWSLSRSLLAAGIMLTSLYYLPLHFSIVLEIITSVSIGATIYATGLVLIGEFTPSELIALLNR